MLKKVKLAINYGLNKTRLLLIQFIDNADKSALQNIVYYLKDEDVLW